MSAKRNPRYQDDGPTWPGLVDLFAFGMAIMIVLLVVTINKSTWQQKQAEFREDRIQAIHDAIIARDSSLADFVKLDRATKTIRVEAIAGGPIMFEKSRWTLSPSDESKLRSLVAAIGAVVVRDTTAIVKINGTADPDPLKPGQFLRDNVELSALRAAAVARLLRESTPELTASKRVQVIGLGEMGAVRARDDKDREIEYQKYRTVRFEIQIDANRIAADQLDIR